MSCLTLIDAGPSLNFFSVNHERLLIEMVGSLTVPETVRDEILRKAQRDSRFSAASGVMKKLPKRFFEVVSDSSDDEYLTAAVERLMRYEGASERSFDQRKRRPQDLGELMVVAHASVRAERGESVLVLIDDGAGQNLVMKEIGRIKRLRSKGNTAVGSIQIITTVTVLERAAGSKYIPDRQKMRKLYERLRELDNSLQPIENTYLLAPQTWGGASRVGEL